MKTNHIPNYKFHEISVFIGANSTISITICIPTYRRPSFLKRAISSALNQTWKDIQIFISDDASHDETKSILEQFVKEDSRVNFISHKQNVGMLANYQYMIGKVGTEYFSLLSDDDQLLPNFCEVAVKGLSRDPELAFFACSTIVYSQEKGILKVSLNKWAREGRFDPPYGLCEMVTKYPFPMNVLFRTTRARQAKIDMQNPHIWDPDFLMQLAAQFPFAISKTICGIFSHHIGSLTSSQTSLVFIQAMNRLQERVDEFPKIDDLLKEKIKGLIKLDIARALRAAIVESLLRKQFTEAKIYSDRFMDISTQKWKVVSFSFLVKICSIVPFMSLFVLYLKQIQKFYRKRIRPIRLRDCR